jgi:hypothetical protein
MILNVRLYDIIRRELKVSDEIAKEIVLSIQQVAEEEHKKCNQKIEFLTKDIQALANHMDLRFSNLEEVFDLKLNSMEGRINTNMERNISRLTRWMVGTWVAQLVAIATILLLLKH